MEHQDKIRQRAYQLWEDEGRPEGRAADHWSRAEQELQGGPAVQQDDVEKSLLQGDDKPTPYLNPEAGRASR